MRAVRRPGLSGGGLAVLHGNLAPDGALIKHGRGDPALLQHTGRAVVFESLADLACASTIPRWTLWPTTCWC